MGNNEEKKGSSYAPLLRRAVEAMTAASYLAHTAAKPGAKPKRKDRAASLSKPGSDAHLGAALQAVHDMKKGMAMTHQWSMNHKPRTSVLKEQAAQWGYRQAECVLQVSDVEETEPASLDLLIGPDIPAAAEHTSKASPKRFLDFFSTKRATASPNPCLSASKPVQSVAHLSSQPGPQHIQSYAPTTSLSATPGLDPAEVITLPQQSHMSTSNTTAGEFKWPAGLLQPSPDPRLAHSPAHTTQLLATHKPLHTTGCSTNAAKGPEPAPAKFMHHHHQSTKTGLAQLNHCKPNLPNQQQLFGEASYSHWHQSCEQPSLQSIYGSNQHRKVMFTREAAPSKSLPQSNCSASSSNKAMTMQTSKSHSTHSIQFNTTKASQAKAAAQPKAPINRPETPSADGALSMLQVLQATDDDVPLTALSRASSLTKASSTAVKAAFFKDTAIEGSGRSSLPIRQPSLSPVHGYTTPGKVLVSPDPHARPQGAENAHKSMRECTIPTVLAGRSSPLIRTHTAPAGQFHSYLAQSHPSHAIDRKPSKASVDLESSVITQNLKAWVHQCDAELVTAECRGKISRKMSTSMPSSVGTSLVRSNSTTPGSISRTISGVFKQKDSMLTVAGSKQSRSSTNGRVSPTRLARTGSGSPALYSLSTRR